jgi:hypothetical protein
MATDDSSRALEQIREWSWGAGAPGGHDLGYVRVVAAT